MKQRMNLWMMSLLFGILPMTGANVSNDPSQLTFGETWMEGGCRAELVQRLHIAVTNNGDKDYVGSWKAINPEKGYEYDHSYCNNYTHVGYVMFEVHVAAGTTEDVVAEFVFDQEGSYDLTFICPEQEEPLFNYHAEIAEYQAPRLKVDLRVDMLDQTDSLNTLYLNFGWLDFKVSGTATITNEGDDPVFGFGRWVHSDIYVMIDPDIEYGIFHPMATNYFDLTREIKSGETITKDFSIDLSRTIDEDDKEYFIEVCLLNKTITHIPFKIKWCTNTYWTADGHCKPLEVKPDGKAFVPEEATAVDLRGQYVRTMTPDEDDEEDIPDYKPIETPLTALDLSAANPNCLYYLGFLDNVPRGIKPETNIIRDDEASTLFVDGNHDYFCPLPFKARTALFTYTPVSETLGPASPVMNTLLSGTFLLPFEAQQATLTQVNGSEEHTDGNMAPFISPDFTLFNFKEISKSSAQVVFTTTETSTLQAYTPYFILMKPSPIMFSAVDITVPATREVMMTTGNFNIVGYTRSVTAEEGCYLYNSDSYQFLRNDERTVLHPFTTYISVLDVSESFGNTDYLTISADYGIGGEATDIRQTKIVSRQQPVYSLSGQQVGIATIDDNGQPQLSGLKPGIYIVNRQKVVIK